VEQNAGLLRFVKQLIGFSSSLHILQEDRFWFATTPQKIGDITWHGLEPKLPDWSPESRYIGYCLKNDTTPEKILVLFNASDMDQTFKLPTTTPNMPWHQIIDTSESSPNDIHDPRKAPEVSEKEIFLVSKSTKVLKTTAPNSEIL